MAESRPDSAFGVSKNIVNGSKWRWRQSNRDSRVQSIAATGRDLRYSLAESVNGYTTETSSIRCADHKPSLELASEYANDPVMSAVHFLQSPKAPRQPPLATINSASAILATNNRLASFARSHHVRDSSVLWMNNGEYGQGSANAFSHEAPPLHSRTVHQLYSHGTAKPEMAYGNVGNKTASSSKFMVYSNHLGATFAPSLAELRCGDMNIRDLIGDSQGSSGANESSTLGSPPCFWIDAMGASTQELHELGDMFELHPLTVEEITCGSSRDRIDTFGDYISIVYRTLAKVKQQRCSCGEESCSLFSCKPPFANNTSFSQASSMEENNREGQVYIIMKSNCVLTFHRDYAQQEAVSRVLQRLAAISSAAADMPRDGAELYDNGESLAGLLDYPPYIVYAILDEITDQLSPEIVEIEQQVDAIDELVLGLSHAQHESALKRMGEQRRRILLTWQLAHPKPRIIEALIRQVPV
ncbi:CorA metal ion transporter, partial [Coemansia sp. S17]